MPQSGEAGMLKKRLRQHLIGLAQGRKLTTYGELAGRLGLKPPQTIRQLTDLLEILMAEDAKAKRPQLAAICVGRLRGNLPAPGFFLAAEALGLFEGEPEGSQAREFHLKELNRLFDLYRR
jgi:hypothetical protein